MTRTVSPSSNNPIAANAGLNVGPDLITEEFGWRAGLAFLTGVVFIDSDHNGFYKPGEGVGSVTIEAVGQESQATFQTQTWNSGGYSLELPPGTYNVTAIGGNLPAPQATTITIGKDNVAWDIQLPATAASDNSASPAPVAAHLALAPSAQSVDSAGPNVKLSTASAHAGKKHGQLLHARGPLSLTSLVHHHSRHALQGLGSATRRPG